MMAMVFDSTQGTTAGWTTADRVEAITWHRWNAPFGTSAATTTSVTDPWGPWNDITTGATGADRFDTIYPDEQWITWSRTATFRGVVEQGMRRTNDPELDRRLRVQEEAHRRQRAADRRVYEVRMRQHKAKREAAEQRAEMLLMSILSTAQQAQYKAERRFTVHLPNGHSYRVKKGRHGNIERINDRGVRIENLCVHVAPPEIPDCDNMAAQKLLLEHNEPELRRIANIAQY